VREKTVALPFAEQCLRPRCRKEVYARGLCDSDYQVAHRLVADGIVTWEQLEKSGRAAERKRNAKEWFLGVIA